LNIFQILDSVLDLLAGGKIEHSDSLSSSAALLSLNLLSSIKDQSEFLGIPESRKTLDKLFAIQSRPLSVEHVYTLASSLHRLNWGLFDNFLLPKLLDIIPSQLPPSSPPSTSESTASLLADILSTRNSKLFAKVFDSLSGKIEEATKVILDHLSSFHLSSPDAPLQQTVTQTTSLKECYDWISVSLLLPSENMIFKRDEVEEWFQRTLMIPTPSDNDVTEGLRAKYISDYESGTPINRTMLLSTMMNVARRLGTTEESRLRTMFMDRLPFIVGVWGWHRGIFTTVLDICQDAQNRCVCKTYQ
jgi:hypothetical protein